MEGNINRGMTCPNCKATLLSNIERCPFCDKIFINENDIKISTNDDCKNDNKKHTSENEKTNFKTIFNKYFNFTKDKINEILDTFDKKALKKVCICIAIGAGTCSILITSLLIFDKINSANFEKIKNELSEQEVADIEIPLAENTENLIPLSYSSSIYENESFYMFQLTSLPKHNKTPNSTYLVSAYIQKPNNVLEYFCSDTYGTISTDKFDINLTLRSGPNANKKVDLLFINKEDQIKRMSNYIINGNSFETYEVKNENSLKYYMISDPIDNMYFVYSITYYDIDSTVKNFNFLTHLIFTKK